LSEIGPGFEGTSLVEDPDVSSICYRSACRIGWIDHDPLLALPLHLRTLVAVLCIQEGMGFWRNQVQRELHRFFRFTVDGFMRRDVVRYRIDVSTDLH